MAKTFNTMLELQNYVEHKVTEALRFASQRIREKLKEIIDEQYYNDINFQPSLYVRTEQLLNSATYTMLSSKTAMIYMDADGIWYKNGFDPAQVIEWAGLYSMHGGEMYQTSTTPFWEVFMDWCNGNVLNIVKEELKKVGIKTE